MTTMLANQLTSAYEVYVLSLHNEYGTENKLTCDVRQTVLAEDKIGLIATVLKIRSFLRENRIGYLINVDVGICIYGIPACFGTKTRVITWEHANFYNNWGSRWFPYFRSFAAKHSDAMVVLTERDRENYQSNIKSKVPVYAIPNPAPRQAYHYQPESKTILSAGLLLPIKGYDKAILAAAKILPKHPEWQWIICGEGPERERLEKLISEHGLEKQMLLPGTVQDMPSQYQRAAFCVMTSQMEGLPLVLLEAKSWGLPIVSFDIMTGPSDIVRDGVNGFLVPPGNVDTLAERIEQLIRAEDLRCRFSEQSQLDMEKFEFERIVNQWKELLK